MNEARSTEYKAVGAARVVESGFPIPAYGNGYYVAGYQDEEIQEIADGPFTHWHQACKRANDLTLEARLDAAHNKGDFDAKFDACVQHNFRKQEARDRLDSINADTDFRVTLVEIDEREQLHDQIQALEAQNDDLAKQVDRFAVETAVANDRYDKLRSDVSRLKAENDDLADQRDELAGAYDRINNRCRRLEHAIHELSFYAEHEDPVDA